MTEPPPPASYRPASYRPVAQRAESRRTRSLPLLAAALAAGLSLAGCSFLHDPPQVRGNRVATDLLKQLTPGTSTRTDAAALLGTPTAKATFDDNEWIYIGQMTRPVIGRTNTVLSQDVVLLTFNSDGVLHDIKHLDKADSLPVDVIARATPSPGSEASFMQQLLGNIGRFSPGGSLGGLGGGSSGPPGGGAPSQDNSY